MSQFFNISCFFLCFLSSYQYLSDAEMDKWASLEMQIQMVGSFLTWFLRFFESQIQFVDYLIYKIIRYNKCNFYIVFDVINPHM
jgi:hypothetical protein